MQVDVSIEDAFVTGVLRNYQAVRQELSTTVVRAVQDTIKNKQADSAICRETQRTLEAESFGRDISQCILEAEPVEKSFATHDKRHVYKELDDWRAMTNPGTTVAEFSDRVNDVPKSSEKEPVCIRKRLVYDFHSLDHALASHTVINPAVCILKKSPTLTLSARQVDFLTSRAK